MNRCKFIVAGAALAVCTGMVGFAEELEEVEETSRWSLSVGPAWRSRVKMTTRGHITMPAPTPNGANLHQSDIAPVKDPLAGSYGVPEDALLWGYSDTYAVLNGAAWSHYGVDVKDSDAPLGVNIATGYDLYQGETLVIGLNLRFAGYWNMKSSTSAGYDVWRKDYVYATGTPPASQNDTAWQGSVEPNIDIASLYNTQKVGSDYFTTRLRSDLYQIGLGPKVTWSPFIDVCPALEWIDVYGGVEILCNISYARFSADGVTSSSTDCLLGFGGNLGLTGNITDWLAVYGQVGYEWVDDTNIRAGGFQADIDYSSLVVSAGLIFSF